MRAAEFRVEVKCAVNYYEFAIRSFVHSGKMETLSACVDKWPGVCDVCVCTWEYVFAVRGPDTRLAGRIDGPGGTRQLQETAPDRRTDGRADG